ncbi:hypothetical protein [Phosphitispora fastidiosa]|uniref:hypothetical protein n=1 Tax=Phosphitispora fastidiosa TaxID=2837202 RepID=UPI001E43606A|nr:hypothetical protein [Phosphitispora fastidiosa]MBU7007783.1 hypothetical protein [Phosphitispora fastidiosa]
MKKWLIASILTISLLLAGIFVAYAAQDEIPTVDKMDPVAEEFEKNKGEAVDLIGIPVIIKNKDGKVYKTTTDKFIKEKDKIEKELKVKF